MLHGCTAKLEMNGRYSYYLVLTIYVYNKLFIINWETFSPSSIFVVKREWTQEMEYLSPYDNVYTIVLYFLACIKLSIWYIAIEKCFTFNFLLNI